MTSTYESKNTSNGLTLKLYRGEGAALLAFDLAPIKATPDFVGFTIEVRYPGSSTWGALRNRLHFTYPPTSQAERTFKSTEAPFQKFRWIHVPSDTPEGDFEYRVTARYMSADGKLSENGPQVTGKISLAPQTIDGFVNVGFTRGFASSQAYANTARFKNNTKILPPHGSPAKSSLSHNMAPFEEHYKWLGFEARRLILDLLQEVESDQTLTLDALVYECKEPDILQRLERLKDRLRVVIDDHDEQGEDDSCESISAQRLKESGAQVQRMHFGRQQHNKVLIVRKRDGSAVKVLAGSTNFALRGLYIQANNALLFEDRIVAEKFAEVFDAYWTDPKKFKKSPLSKQWWEVRNEPESKVSVCFSPHTDNSLSLGPVAKAIAEADSSVLYSIVFLNQLTGVVRQELEALMHRPLFSYGVAQRTSGLSVTKPDGSIGLLPFSYLAEKAPEPFKSEWNGDTTERSNMVHHKFVVTDFNGKKPTVFTGSSNLAAGGELDNGDHLIRIEDRKIAIAYAIEALRLFDHFHFRVKIKSGEVSGPIFLAKPPTDGGQPWFASYYIEGHYKERDRKLFVQ
ncbi:phospholipase D-like domain-containing protein [Pseudomonas migulae]|uniref:phospholipase D-like domain-containing protein n=1 Tax=Pseudomonas migulae TaxID=78543 RepID=UPI00371298B0